MTTARDQASRRRMAVLGILALALVTALGMTLGSSAEAKKKKKGPTVFQASVSPNAAIPDDNPTGPSTPLTSTITVGKKFKGRQVADVNVTGLQTTGNVDGAADDLGFKLTAPNGRTVRLVTPGNLGGTSIGPLTIDDQSPVSICDSTTPTCEDPSSTLVQPFAGTANELSLGSGGTGGLKAFRLVFMKGTWTLTVWDESGSGQTSVLNAWGLQITRARPVL
jgi:hypothetical protein